MGISIRAVIKQTFVNIKVLQIRRGPLLSRIFNRITYFFQWFWKHLPTPNQITFVVQTTENSEGCRNTADKTQFTLQTNQNFRMLGTLTGRK